MSSIVKKSQELQRHCIEFSVLYLELIQLFKDCGETADLEIMDDYWEIALKAAGLITVVDCMSVYFLKYKDLIMADEVQQLLDIDYTKEIVEGCAKSTTKVIKKLIVVFKNTWLIADFTSKTLIKLKIKLLTQKAMQVEMISSKIK